MTYIDTEVSDTDGAPIELYRFHGTYQNFYYTSAQLPIIFQASDDDVAHSYLPIALQRSALNVGTQEDDAQALTIDIGVQHELVKAYAFRVSPPDLELTIFRYHDIGQYVPYWRGPVSDVKATGGKATIRAPSVLTYALSSDIPNVFFQTPCNHTLFDSRCKVPEVDWTVAAVVVNVAGRNIEITDVGALAGFCIGGELILSSGERRMMTAQAGNIITVNFPFSQIEIDEPVILKTGCDHAYTGDCRERFDNNVNFGGYPFIPPENPFETGMIPGSEIEDSSCPPPVLGDWFWKVRFTIIGSVGASNNTTHRLTRPGSPSWYNPPRFYDGAGRFLGCEWSFNTDIMTQYPGTFTHYYQFPFQGGATGKVGMLQIRRWDQVNYTLVNCTNGNVNGTYNLQNLWPQTKHFAI